jgi:hypothetical protein
MPTDTEAEVKLVLDGALTMRTIDTVRAKLRAAIELPFGAPSAGTASPGSAFPGIPSLGIPSTGIETSGIETSGIETPGIETRSIAIDCSAASEIDLTFIQLLIAARVSIGASGGRLSLAHCPDGPLMDTLTRGGFRLEPEIGGGFWFRGEAA